jgi:dipeptidyl-peptidase-4
MKQGSIRYAAAALLLVTPVLLSGRQAASPAAPAAGDMVDRIFKAREFSSRPPAPPMWLEGGASYARLEPVAGGGAEVVKYGSATGARGEVLITAAHLTPPGAPGPLEVDELSWSADGQRVLVFTNARRVWRTNSRGDYWLLDRRAGRLKKLGGDAPGASLQYAQFNADATRVAYVRQNDIYVEDLAGGAITRLTRDGSDRISNGGADWVNEEELDLHDCFRWSPDGTRIAFWQFDMRGVGNFPLIYNLGKEREVVTQLPYPHPGPYPTIMSVPYPLAGTTNSAVRVGVVDAQGGAVRWMRLPGEAREHYVARLQWADARTLLVQQLNRLQNTVRYLLAEAANGSVREMWSDRDEAFIPIGFGGLPEARALADGKAFLVLSEKDGWMHVYRVTREGRHALVTRGAFDAISVAGVDEAGGRVYFVASPDNATQRYLYRAPIDGRADPERVTPAEFSGTNAYTVSPDGRFAVHRYSRFDDPGITALVSLPAHKRVAMIDDNAALKEKVAPLLEPPVEYFKVDAGDGVQVDGYMLKPARFDSAKRYPILVYVYGEPAGQTVEDRWGGATALYHRHLASLGYLVVSFDNSGTPAPRGRPWRKAIYGAVGVLSSKQQAQALRSLASARPYLDLDRVAVWGWSGGGTNTLNLMFRSPELYKVGMSVAPVPDQRLYDTIYQERYMGLPAGNTDGYRQASAINFAEGLRGNLLIVHGSGDDNVHYQGTELLVNRLIELEKRFDLMTYPDRSHGLSEGPGTAPHVYHLLTRYLTTHLPAGPRDAPRSQAPPAQAATPPRPTPPTRDPNTPGYVQARELPDGTLPPAGAEGNFIIGPTHNPAPEMTVRDDVLHGTVHNFTMSSADSKIYPGIARDAGTFGTPDPTDPAKLVVTTSRPAPYTRRVAVYVPPQYVPGTAAPFIVGADGPDPLLFTALDNLIAQKRVPPMIAISIGNGGGDAQGSQRGLEYDTMSGRYAEFVETEVLPLVEKQANVRLTRDPDGRATMGCSSGAAAALSMAWYHPEWYRRVLSYSGTFVNQQWPPSAETPHGAWEYHERLIPDTPARPIRIWMQVGDRDLLNPNVMRDNMHDWVLANENMARALAAKKYHYQFVFSRNAGHCDRPTKLQTLPAALEWLWKGYAVR